MIANAAHPDRINPITLFVQPGFIQIGIWQAGPPYGILCVGMLNSTKGELPKWYKKGVLVSDFFHSDRLFPATEPHQVLAYLLCIPFN